MSYSVLLPKIGLPVWNRDKRPWAVGMLVSSFDQLERGSVFHGRYRVERRLGAGAMGAVYEVIDEKTQSLRALKVMQPELVRDPVLRERFAQEAQITGKIESDHLVRVLDAGVDSTSGMPFLTMELLRGETLSRELERRRVLPKVEVAQYLQQISFALTKTHAAGVVHRDLKPDNLFVTTRDDGSRCIKILDFGIAKVVARSHQGAATRVGTPLYMAPEQLAGKGTVGPPTDMHALGHLAYEMLVGEPYWAEEMRSTEGVMPFFDKLLKGPVELPSIRAKRRCDVTLPAAFDEFFSKAVARDPAHRYANAAEFVEAFSQVDKKAVAWMARTVAAAPLVQVFEPSQDPANQSSEDATLVMPPSKQKRDFDAATTVPLRKKPNSTRPRGAWVGAIVVLCILVLLVVLNVSARKETTKTDELSVPIPSSISTVAPSESPPLVLPSPSASPPPLEPPLDDEAPVISESASASSDPLAPSPPNSKWRTPTGEEQPVERVFNRAAASSALNSAAQAARGCKKPNGPTGTTKVKVTFAPSGKVTTAQLQGLLFAGTPIGNCIVASFRSIKVPPFEGTPVSVTKTVTIN